MIKIFGVKTDGGYYISANPKTESYNRGTGIDGLIVNGEIPEPTFHGNWLFSKSEPMIVQRVVKQPNINHRYVLVDDSFVTEEVPKTMPKHEVMETNEDGYCGWKDEFKHLQSLYTEVSDPQPDVMEDVEFEYKTILEVPIINTANGFSYEVFKSRWEHEGAITVSPSEIEHQIVDKIVFPSVVLPDRPCRLSSKQSYDIIRYHIKQNIDYNAAEITSDYDFCFTVKKKIILNNPRHIKIEIKKRNGKSYKNPRFRENFIKSRSVEVFEMTHAENAYKGYTPIDGFRGKNHADLQKNIDKYLSDIMELINEPLCDCPKCNGMGVIVQ